MPVPKAASDHYRQMQRLQTVGVLAARREWAKVDPASVRLSWAARLPVVAAVATALQVRAASEGASYGASTLAEQGTWTAPDAFVDPRGFGGFASDGRALDRLLSSPSYGTLAALGAGLDVDEALRRGLASLERIMQTQIADTARAAGGVDVAARPRVGYVRMVNLPSCGDCLISAGRFYRWNEGFLRHPNCFPEGVVASGPSLDGATRRWYEGELVVLATESGQRLPLTGNHPVLTRRGWIPANLIQEGDEVFRSTQSEGATALVVPDHDQVPSRVEDIWGSFSVSGLDTVESAPEDFHGDGQHGEVYVVRADGPFNSWVESLGHEHVSELDLSYAPRFALGFAGESGAELVDLRDAAFAHGLMGFGGLGGSLLRGHLSGSHFSGLTEAAPFDASFEKSLLDGSAANAVLLGQGEFARAAEVLLDDLVGGQRFGFPRWNAPAGEYSVETASGYAERGVDLLDRLAGQVTADRAVFVERVDFSGHVYSLQSSEGWHSANSLIVSNCDCVHIPSAEAIADDVTIDPYAGFNSMTEAEQDRAFTKAGAEAIRDGGDMYQVQNARRGRSEDRMTTTEGTTRRGHWKQSGGTGERLTPEGIYSQKLSRDDTLKLLESNGYILPGGQVPGGSIRGDVEGFGALGRGGTRVGARQAVERARETGVRDPGSRYTMTAAERRLHDSRARYEDVLAGRNPYGKEPLTPELSARAENDFRRWLTTGGQIYTK